MGDAFGIAKRRNRLELEKTQNYNPAAVRNEVARGLAFLRGEQGLNPLEILGVADGMFMTIATTLLEVAEPGPGRERVRTQLTEILDRMRRAVETAPENTSGEQH